eukprot:c26237_g2_i2 orf=506-943(+)
MVIASDQFTNMPKLQARQCGQSLSDNDLWTSSSNEMDNSAWNSRSSSRRILAVSASSNLEICGSSDNVHAAASVNHALFMWNERRREWIGNRSQLRSSKAGSTAINWMVTYEELLGTSHPFPQPIPLSEMVNFLVDIWDQEGLYD